MSSKCGPQARSNSITRKLTRNANSQFPAQICRIRNSGGEPQHSVVQQVFGWFCTHPSVINMNLCYSLESWAPKNWCFWTVVLEKTLESPLDCKEIQPVHPKRDQSWVFIGRTDAEAETPILWPPHVKSWLTGKDLDAGRDWGQEEKGTTEDEMARWHHRLEGHESE